MPIIETDGAGPAPSGSASNGITEQEKKKKRPPETTLFALQAKQVKLLETQTVQLERIGDLLSERNTIEKEKLDLMKHN